MAKRDQLLTACNSLSDWRIVYLLLCLSSPNYWLQFINDGSIIFTCKFTCKKVIIISKSRSYWSSEHQNIVLWLLAWCKNQLRAMYLITAIGILLQILLQTFAAISTLYTVHCSMFIIFHVLVIISISLSTFYTPFKQVNSQKSLEKNDYKYAKGRL